MLGTIVLVAAMQAVNQTPAVSPDVARATASMYGPGTTFSDLAKPVDPAIATAECRDIEGGWIAVYPKMEMNAPLVKKSHTMFKFITEGGRCGVGSWKEKSGNYVLKYQVKMGSVPAQTVFPKSEFWPCRL